MKNNTIYSEFTLNQFGIAKVSFIPKIDNAYSVIINTENEEITAKT